MIDEIFSSYTERLNSTFEDRLKECCLVWGVDIDNPDEIRERCEIVYRDWSDLREVQIDGQVVMYFTDWKVEPQKLDEPFKLKATFKCSEIRKP